jgi:ABC-type uncharacterized transport system permease subunit
MWYYGTKAATGNIPRAGSECLQCCDQAVFGIVYFCLHLNMFNVLRYAFAVTSFHKESAFAYLNLQLRQGLSRSLSPLLTLPPQRLLSSQTNVPLVVGRKEV